MLLKNVFFYITLLWNMAHFLSRKETRQEGQKTSSLSGLTPQWLEVSLLVRLPYRVACFRRRLRQSAIMAMNSLLVGLPLIFDTV